MKIFFLYFLLITSYIISQEKNRIKYDEYSEPMLIGYCSREAFNDSSFSVWFNAEYDYYHPDSSAVELLKEKIKGIKLVVIMGTWCDDSRIHIPHLYKVLDKANYPSEEITLIAVDEDKKTESGEIDKLAVEFVPTIIIYKDDTESGRIVESPIESIEEDFLEIISGNP